MGVSRPGRGGGQIGQMGESVKDVIESESGARLSVVQEIGVFPPGLPFGPLALTDPERIMSRVGVFAEQIPAGTVATGDVVVPDDALAKFQKAHIEEGDGVLVVSVGVRAGIYRIRAGIYRIREEDIGLRLAESPDGDGALFDLWL